MLDLTQLRADTPGADELIHFNNAGASLMPRVVLETVIGHLQREAVLGGYEAAAAASQRLENVYASIARLLNVRPDEIAVVENATRAWDMAFYSLPLRTGDVILTSATEYAGNYIPYLQLQRQRGIEVRIVADGATQGAGVVGGVEVRGPNVFAGYWNLPDKTREDFSADGWFRTGDVGELVADGPAAGYLRLVGRAKDLIICG